MEVALPAERSETARTPTQGVRSSEVPAAWLRLAVLVALWAALAGCERSPGSREVVVYTSVDQPYSEPVLERFERETGIQAKAVYDVEATKTTGLVNRLLAEEARPQADVFWNGEFAQTLLLAERGILEPYTSPNAADIPAQFADPQGYWTGFCLRARVLIANRDRLPAADFPKSILDLADERYPADEVGIANPLFGTTASHAAALYAAWGAEEARAYFERLRERGVQVVDGNSVVRDMVADGRLAVGLTDTDDARGAVERGAPVEVIFPDQGEGQLGTLVIPNTVCLIAGGPNPEEGRSLVDFLLRADAEKDLIEAGWSYRSIRDVGSASGRGGMSIQAMSVGLEAICRAMPESREALTAVFVR